MPSVVALRRWLVCVAGLRLMSGSTPPAQCVPTTANVRQTQRSRRVSLQLTSDGSIRIDYTQTSSI